MANKIIDNYVIKRHKELEITLKTIDKKSKKYNKLLKEYINFTRYLLRIEKEQGQ